MASVMVGATNPPTLSTQLTSPTIDPGRVIQEAKFKAVSSCVAAMLAQVSKRGYN